MFGLPPRQTPRLSLTRPVYCSLAQQLQLPTFPRVRPLPPFQPDFKKSSIDQHSFYHRYQKPLWVVPPLSIHSNHCYRNCTMSTQASSHSARAQPTINPTIPDDIPLSSRPPKARKRFAPLDGNAPNTTNAPKLKGVVFDVDGTLCEPQTWMFAAMRQALGIPKSVDILGHIHSLPTPEASDSAMEKVKAIERTAMHQMIPQRGLLELMTYLDSKSILKAICTRNFDGPVAHLRDNFMPGILFHPVITRTFIPPKPDPAGINHICQTWGVDGREVIMVGDSLDDMAAGRRAGAATVLLRNDVNGELIKHEFTDCVVGSLDELVGVLERGFEEVDRSSERGLEEEMKGKAEEELGKLSK